MPHSNHYSFAGDSAQFGLQASDAIFLPNLSRKPVNSAPTAAIGRVTLLEYWVSVYMHMYKERNQASWSIFSLQILKEMELDPNDTNLCNIVTSA